MSLSGHDTWSNLALLRLNAFGVGINSFFLGADTVILPVLVLVLAPDALKNSSVGLLGVSGLVVAGLVQVVVARFSDRTRSRLGRRVPYMICGCLIVCLGMVGIGFAPHFLLLFVVWLVVQAGINVGYGPYLALIQDLVPANRTGVASAIKILADAAGGVTFIWISTRVMGMYAFGAAIEWLWVALIILGINLIVATSISSVAVLRRQPARPRPADQTGTTGFRPPGLHPQLRWFLASRFMLVAPVAVFQAYGLFFLRDRVGLENPVVGLGNMILFVGSGIAVSAYLAEWGSDKFGRKPVLLAGSFGAAGSTWWMLSAGSATEVLVIATVIGLSVGALLSSNWALANDMGTSGREAMHMGVVNLATIGGAASAKLLGPGVDLLNSASPTSGYLALLMGCGTSFLVGGLVLLPVRADLRRPPS